MALEDIDPAKMREQMLASAKGSNGVYYVDQNMIEDMVNYCTKQFNDASVRTNINSQEYAVLVSESISGLFFLTYIKHYKVGENLLEKEAYFIAMANWLHMMYRAMIGGNFARTIVAENQSRVAPNMIVSR